ncbi:cyclic nucleotide-binding domain-containing protein [Rhodothermus profundi]|uniref:cAMP-binding domain of CRP or a regulatory subunit of cAMP-dependent protein kinases n=1 Tax=Rhodothermus profundi TaxID=633813 RepID=A0A1M6TN82_9BACT|nr:cyclic nucleotide-binding domain-containing protein [Rhodothermus profundi]SHK58390.1 cAMP-binding domain of CRP or a regulatory subunit of cAMP-dependent protein kinases [Rhodothermus profundi]
MHTLWHTLQHAYQRLFQAQEDAHTRELLHILRHVPIFQHLPRRTLRTLLPYLHARTYRRHEVLYFEGDPGLGLYIITRGTVRLLTENEHGQLEELTRLSEYDTCGHLALLGEFRRLETAQAATEVQVLGFFRPDLKLLLRRHPTAGAAILQAVARYVAARQVELVGLLEQCANRRQALIWLQEAGRRAEHRLPSLLSER